MECKLILMLLMLPMRIDMDIAEGSLWLEARLLNALRENRNA